MDPITFWEWSMEPKYFPDKITRRSNLWQYDWMPRDWFFDDGSEIHPPLSKKKVSGQDWPNRFCRWILDFGNRNPTQIISDRWKKHTKPQQPFAGGFQLWNVTRLLSWLCWWSISCYTHFMSSLSSTTVWGSFQHPQCQSDGNLLILIWDFPYQSSLPVVCGTGMHPNCS